MIHADLYDAKYIIDSPGADPENFSKGGPT